MYRFLIALFIAMPGVVLAQNVSESPPNTDLSYSLVDLKFVDGDNGADGLRVGGSYRLNRDWFVLGDITDLDYDGGLDQSIYQLGAGYIHGRPEQEFDLFGTVSVIRSEYDGRFVDYDDTGIALSAGVRGLVSPQVELRGSVNHINLDDSDTFLEAGADYYLTERFSAGVNLRFASDNDQLSVGVRFYDR